MLATVAAEHAVSSGTLDAVAQENATHVASSRVPWQLAASSHAGGEENDPGQSVAVEQHVPPEQQKPLLQVLLMQSEASSQEVPLGWSGTQRPPSQ